MSGTPGDAKPDNAKADATAVTARTSTGPPVVTSDALLAGGRELIIRHGAERYRLMLTGQNKLILTK